MIGGFALVSKATPVGPKSSRPSMRLGLAVEMANGSGLGMTGCPTSREGTALMAAVCAPAGTLKVKNSVKTRRGLSGIYVTSAGADAASASFEHIKPD